MRDDIVWQTNYAREEPLARLYNVADDGEADILDLLLERAGITWEHEGCWTNREDDRTCQRCGSARETSERRDH
jgi:hypothetical protein